MFPLCRHEILTVQPTELEKFTIIVARKFIKFSAIKICQTQALATLKSVDKLSKLRSFDEANYKNALSLLTA